MFECALEEQIIFVKRKLINHERTNSIDELGTCLDMWVTKDE